MRPRTIARALALVLLGASGCADRTALKIEVSSSDLTAPDDVDRLEIRVVGDATGMMSDDRFALSSTWPHSLSVRPGSSRSEGVVVTVTGRKSTGPSDTTGAFVVRRVVRDAFVDGEDRTVRVELSRACSGVMCAEGIDCTDGHCASGDGGVPDGGPMMDAGPRDGALPEGGLDAAVDASSDAGSDAGPFDAGCLSSAACDDLVACTVDTCDTGTCTHRPDDALCAPGDTCDLVAGCGGRACTGPSDCDDGNFCNGAETCDATSVCRTGMAPSCDDGDPCTDGTCMGTAPGACMQRTRDADGDGHGAATCPALGGVPADDCNDAVATAFPGAPETCNGADDDCNTACDNGFACCRGMSGSCTTACGSTGTRICDLSCAWGACAPPAETCNGMDDDCNGMCDDGVGCCQGTVSTCTTSCGSPGTRTCSGACVPGPCDPPAETCNGVDDNCNATIDEGFACEAGSVAPCMASCGTVGSSTCSATCTAGACVPPAELCGNGVDDDCDTMIDEGCMAGCTGTCAGARPVTGSGGRFTAMLAAGTDTGTCGGAGSEAIYTFTLTGTSDVFITTHGTPIDTVVYVRSCSCTGTEVGCNDDADGVTSSVVQLNALAGGTYTVFIDTKVAMSAMVTADIYISPAAAAGDRCGRPTRFVGPTAMGNTCGMASDTNGNCEFTGSLDGPDRVYYLLVTGAARDIAFDTCTGCTGYDSSLELRRVCTPTGLADRLGCNDDSCRSTCGGSGRARQSRVATTGLAPGLYYVFVDGYGAFCGDYVLTSTGL